MFEGQTGSAGLHSRNLTDFGRLPIIFLLFACSLIMLERAVVPEIAFNVDPASYAVVGHELLQGEALYTDIWDHKPPAVFVVFALAELTLGYSPQTLLILNLVVALVTLFGIYFAGRSGPGGAIAGIMAAALWVIFSATFQLEGRDPNTEPFLNACIVWAFALLMSNREGGISRPKALIVGVLFLIASLFKPIIVVIALALVAGYVLFAAVRKRAFVDAVVIASVGAVGWFATFGYFAMTGRFDIFYDSVVSYNFFYSGDLVGNFVAPARRQAEFFPDFMNPLAMAAIVGVIMTFARSRFQAGCLLAFIGSSWIAIALPGRFSVHYFQLWLPPLIVGASWAIGAIASYDGLKFRILSYSSAILLLIILVLYQLPVYRTVLAREWVPFISLLNAGNDTADRIDSILKPNETFFAWGNTPTLYLLTCKRPPAPVLFHMHFAPSPISEGLIGRVKSDLDANRPELLVVENSRPPVPDWIMNGYDPNPVYRNADTYTFYARRGGRIAAAMQLSNQSNSR